MRTRRALVLCLLALGACGDPATKEPPGPSATRPPEVRDPSAIRVQLHASGNVILLSKGSDAAADGMVTLAADSPAAQADALVWLRDQFQARTADPITREPDRSSKLWLELELDPDARWQYAQWILQIGAEPTVGLYKIRYFERGAADPMKMLLPKDRGIVEELLEEEVLDEETGEILVREPLREDDDERPRVRVKLFRRNAEDPALAFTRVRIGKDLTFELPRGPVVSPEQEAVYEEAFRPVEEALRALRDAAGGSLHCEIATPRPLGLRVPCRDVLCLMRALVTVGVDDVTLEGAPAPLRR